MQLADGRRFLTGEKPGLVDLHAMWDPWFLDRFAPNEAKRAYARYPRVHEWLARLDAVGHGTRTEMEPTVALRIARESRPLACTGIATGDPLGIAAGTRVVVSPTDYAECEVVGELVGTTVNSLSIKPDDPQLGEVCVHFPKIGYRCDVV
ncbi:MAG: glutathione S-transferase domain-containing protein [Gammaproteobacteria bacterium]|nr:glutathione S-transferase domain-containing protein [Gammaproteobacteria bacterium]